MYSREKYLRERKHRLEYVKEYYRKNRQRILDRARERYVRVERTPKPKYVPVRKYRPRAISEAERKRRIAETGKNWSKANRHKLREYENKYRNRNIQFRLRKILRSRLCNALRHQKSYKCNSTIGLLGCSIQDFKIYLETKFEVGMSWNNYGSVWHIDHIMPCAIFDLSRTEHQKRCFHFSNLQPLFASENQKKHKSIVDAQFRLL